MARMWWKRRKTFAMLANKRQWEREFDPDESSALEIVLEQGGYLVTEASISATPTYIITE
tara:strand:- start:212 stop:391 length:180 start_codon:yes stop_codon:yes gene_type:complete